MLSIQPNDPSKVSDLTPWFPFDLSFQKQKTSLHYQGSFLLNLRRPSRLPAFSRRYIKGDPVRLIDWRSFARNDQLIVREQRDEASCQVLLCIDLSDSLNWPDGIDEHEAEPKKLEIALRVALNIAYTHLRLGDHVRLLLWLNEMSEPTKELLLKNGSQVLSIFERMKKRLFNHKILIDEAVEMNRNVRQADVSYWISDGLGGKGLEWLSEYGKIFRFIHVLSSLEGDIEWIANDTSYYDDSGIKKEYLGRVLLHNRQYQSRLKKWTKKLKDSVHSAGGIYQFVTDQTPISEFHTELHLLGKWGGNE